MKTILAAAAEGDTGILDHSPLAIGRHQLKRLLDAVENGDDTAVEQLVQLAVDAAERVDWVRRAKPEAIAEVAKRRTEFPAVFTYRKSEWANRCEELGTLPLAEKLPFKSSGQADSLRMEIERCWNLFEIIRRSGTESWDWPTKEIGARIINLPPLSAAKAVRDLWANCICDYWIAERPDWRLWKNGWAYDLAMRGLRKRERRAKNPAEEGTERGELRKETRTWARRAVGPTVGDFRGEFRVDVKKWLSRNLK